MAGRVENQTRIQREIGFFTVNCRMFDGNAARERLYRREVCLLKVRHLDNVSLTLATEKSEDHHTASWVTHGQRHSVPANLSISHRPRSFGISNDIRKINRERTVGRRTGRSFNVSG